MPDKPNIVLKGLLLLSVFNKKRNLDAWRCLLNGVFSKKT
jgi:hypothetical protein